MAGSYSTRSSYQSYFCILGFLPTIGELVQADIPQNIDGISYLPTLTGKVLRRSMIVFIMSSLNLEESNLL